MYGEENMDKNVKAIKKKIDAVNTVIFVYNDEVDKYKTRMIIDSYAGTDETGVLLNQVKDCLKKQRDILTQIILPITLAAGILGIPANDIGLIEMKTL